MAQWVKDPALSLLWLRLLLWRVGSIPGRKFHMKFLVQPEEKKKKKKNGDPGFFRPYYVLVF